MNVVIKLFAWKKATGLKIAPPPKKKNLLPFEWNLEIKENNNVKFANILCMAFEYLWGTSFHGQDLYKNYGNHEVSKYCIS